MWMKISNISILLGQTLQVSCIYYSVICVIELGIHDQLDCYVTRPSSFDHQSVPWCLCRTTWTKHSNHADLCNNSGYSKLWISTAADAITLKNDYCWWKLEQIIMQWIIMGICWHLTRRCCELNFRRKLWVVGPASTGSHTFALSDCSLKNKLSLDVSFNLHINCRFLPHHWLNSN